MATAGGKFFEALTNGELGFMARSTGIRIEDWETEASGIQVNGAVCIVASRRAMQPITPEKMDNMTPTATAEKLKELLGFLGFIDDEEAPDLEAQSETEPNAS